MIVFLDPGGDAVQAVAYFALAQGLNAPTFDTSQKVVGVGSYKFDSTGDNDNSYNKVAGVLGQSGRISFYFRYDSIPDTSTSTSGFAESDTEYSGGGFVDPSAISDPDDVLYATATPAKNSGQGSTFEGFAFGAELDPTWVIDSIKIIYERKYSTADSIGISRVRWKVGEEEGPNHDNTEMPTADTVVEVDITAERTWTPADLNAIQVIAEARRGDTDTPHTQLWDYLKVEVGYRTSTPILWGETAGGALVALRLDALPTGSGVVLRYMDADGVSCFNGITIIPPDEDHRIAVSFVEHGLNDLDVKVYLDGVEELSLVGRSTAFGLAWPDLLYGWMGQPGANKKCWVDQLYIDDGFDLFDPGPIHMTAKLPAAVNADGFDTTGGTGAVNERPVSLTNYKQQAGSSQADQNYTLQAAAVGDIDISGETLVGHMGWAVAKQEAGTGTGTALMLDGATTAISPTASPALFKAPVTSPDYPDAAAGIGLRSSGGTADVTLHECGAIVAYEGPIEDILFAGYLLLVETTAEVVDDLRAAPPASYTLRYWVTEGGGTVLFKVYSIVSEGASPQLQTVFTASGGTGVEDIGVPGIEVRVIMEVSDADTYVMLQHYFD